MNLIVPEQAEIAVDGTQPPLVEVTSLMHVFQPPVEPSGPEKFCRDEMWVSAAKDVLYLRDQHCFVFEERVQQIVDAAEAIYLKVM